MLFVSFYLKLKNVLNNLTLQQVLIITQKEIKGSFKYIKI